MLMSLVRPAAALGNKKTRCGGLDLLLAFLGWWIFLVGSEIITPVYG
ncbi:unnamed protein product, partial [Amoebophrya sp. A120]|eukprot:GSA120T00013426001.1